MTGHLLGYDFDPGNRAIGYAALVVTLRGRPTEDHYDPEAVDLHALALSGDARRLTVHHPWHDRTGWHVCPGPVKLEDRKGKVVEAFTFGGYLQIEQACDQTICTLQSPAPIFEVQAGFHTGVLDAVGIFVEEVQIFFARAHAAWGRDDAGFMGRLTATDPLLLYAACRVAVHTHLSAQPEQLRMTRYRTTLHLLRVLAIEDPIPSYMPALDELLGRPLAATA